MTTKPILPGPGPIEPVLLKDALEERTLAYSSNRAGLMLRALCRTRCTKTVSPAMR